MASARATAMNTAVLIWAREQAGLSQAQLAHLLSQQTETVVAWELGTKHPTVGQLDKIAQIVKRPFAVFFFPAPPKLDNPQEKFRTLPISDSQEEVRDTFFAIREAQARQLSILELCDGRNPAGQNYLFEKEHKSTADVRQALKLTLDAQVSWRSAEAAFKEWRQAFEDVGVMVFKRSFKQASISGFCLPHPVAPIIVVNNGTSWTRQIFTLAHELGHLFQGHHGITLADGAALARMDQNEQQIEKSCNQFAAELLLPTSETRSVAAAFGGKKEDVTAAATHYNVSPEVILRRLLDVGMVDHDTYETWAAEWSANFFARRAAKKGKNTGNYYATQASYLGPTFLRLTFGAHLQQKITTAELAEHLGMKAKNISGLEPYVGAAQ